MKLVLVDLDGVIANCDVRKGIAASARDEFVHFSTLADKELEQAATSHYWKVFATPEYLAYDTLIPGAEERLYTLLLTGDIVMFYSSRLENLRDATREWLRSHLNKNMLVRIEYVPLLLKPMPFMYTKTTLWKQGMAETLMHCVCADDVVMIDDDPENFPTHFPVTCYTSLENWERNTPYGAGLFG